MSSPIEGEDCSVRKREQGFTLVELMVTIAVIGLLSAAALLTLPGGEADLQRDAERLGARLVAARDHALFSGRETAAVIEPAGYRFEERMADAWIPLTEAPLAPMHFSDEVLAAAPARIGFDPVGLAEPAEIILARGPERRVVSVGGDGGVTIDAPR